MSKFEKSAKSIWDTFSGFFGKAIWDKIRKKGYFPSLNKRQTSRFCSQLKLLLASGLPLLDALMTIKGMTANKRLDHQLNVLSEKINEGFPLSEAAGVLLPPLAVGSLAAAEKAGNLEETLGRLAQYYESKAELEEKVVGALIYPCFVLAFALISVLVMGWLVLPGFKSMLSDMGGDLPLLTNIILTSGEFLPRFGFLLLAGLVATSYLVFRRLKPTAVLRIPVIGKLIRQELVIQGCGTLGALLKGGVPIVESLAITAASSRNAFFKETILRAKERVENGGQLSAAFSESGLFPDEALRMLKVGEGSGRLAEMLSGAADFQAAEREIMLKWFTALLEPALTLTVGVVVGLVVVAVFLPMITMISSLQ